MSTVIIDRVAVHGENGSILITRDRKGWYYLEARTRSGGKTVVQLHKDVVKAEDGLLDQLQRFTGQPGLQNVPVQEIEPEPDSPTFVELLHDGMAAKNLSPFDLAYLLRLRSHTTVHHWLAGRSLPYRKLLRPIAEALDIDLDTLIDAYGRATATHARKAAA